MRYTMSSSSHIPFIARHLSDTDYNYICVALTKSSNSKQCYAQLKANEDTGILTFVFILIKEKPIPGGFFVCFSSNNPLHAIAFPS